MALRNIVTVGDPVLTKVCRPVTKFDDRLSQLIDDMIETLHDANGAGLAAPPRTARSTLAPTSLTPASPGEPLRVIMRQAALVCF